MTYHTKIIFLILAGWVFACPASAQKAYHGDGPDDVLRLVPWAAVAGLKACGVESRSNWAHLGVNAGATALLTVGIAEGLKLIVDEERPDATDLRSMPSGHAAVAFSGAHVLWKEFGKTSPWIPIAGYAVAVGVGIDRVARNRHHWYDVATGAAIGVAATELGYFIGEKVFPSKKATVSIAPTMLSLRVNL